MSAPRLQLTPGTYRVYLTVVRDIECVLVLLLAWFVPRYVPDVHHARGVVAGGISAAFLLGCLYMNVERLLREERNAARR